MEKNTRELIPTSDIAQNEKDMDIQSLVYEIRNQQVMIDRDLAQMYNVETKQLIRQVKRNIERFEGDDFMFQLTINEYNSLISTSRCQIGTTYSAKRPKSYAPYAFTELGVAMLSSVLRSSTAIKVNRSIMRAFVSARTLTEQYNNLKKEKKIELPDDKILQNAFCTIGPHPAGCHLTLNFLTTKEAYFKYIKPAIELGGGRKNAEKRGGYLFASFTEAEPIKEKINIMCFNCIIPLLNINSVCKYALKELGIYEKYRQLYNLKEQLYA